MANADQKQLLLKVDASVELARRNLSALEQSVARDAAKMDASLGRVDAASNRAGSALGILKTNAAGFLAGIGISAVLSTGKAILDFADDIGTAADQAGISAERYQTLREALRSLELSTDQTDKVLKTLQDTLGQVQSGADSGATKALERLGISAKIMSGEITNGGQLLDALAAASKNAGSEAQFTTALVDIFGKKVGVDLAAALRDGGTALHTAEQAFRDTGSVITTEMINKLADANERIDQFAARAKQGFAIFAAGALDALDQVDLALASLGRGLASVSPLGKPEAFNAEIRNIERRNATKGAYDEQRVRVVAALQKKDRIQAGNGVFRNTELPQAINDYKRELTKLRRIARDFNLNRAAAPALATPKQPEIVVNGRRLSGGSPPSRGGGSRASSPAESFKLPTFEPISNPFGDPEGDRARRLYDQLGADPFDFRKAIEAQDEAWVAIYHKREDLEADLFRQGQDRVRDLAGFLEDAFAGRAGSFWDQFKRTGFSVISQIVARLATNNGGTGGSFGDILKSAGGSALSSLFGGGFADGGSPPLGKFSIVGERGPEIFVPKVPGTIVPNHALGGRSTTISVAVDARGATDPAMVEQAATRAIYAAAPLIIQAAQGRTAMALSRPSLPGSLG